MEIFDIGSTELLLIMLFAVFVLGPERLTVVARKAGRLIRELKAYFSSLTDELQTELDVLEEMKDVEKEINKK